MRDAPIPEEVRTEITNYVGANLALARAIRQNLQDEQANREGIQLCYFVDANVVRWYLNPLDDFVLVSPFIDPSWVSRSRSSSKAEQSNRISGVECATNVITAEYIFSNRLVGAEGFAPFLTPFHADELFESLTNEIGRLQETKDQVDAATLRNAAANLEEAIKAFEKNRSMNDIDKLFKSFNVLLNQTYVGLAFSDPRFRQLFQEGRVVRASEFGDFNLEESYRSEDAVGMWKDTLVQCGKSKSASRKLERDAQTLHMLQHLNYEATVANRPIRFILISTDNDLHSAVDKWRSDQKILGLPSFDFTRHPRQYTPILNLNSMRSIHDQSIRGFKELMQSVDDITLAVFRNDVGDLDAAINVFSHSAKRMGKEYGNRISEEKLLGLRDRVDELTHRWRDALETAVLMNVQLVLGVADDFVSSSIKPLMDEKIDDAFRQQIQNSINDIALGHIKVAAQTQMLALIRMLRRQASTSGNVRHARRHARSPSLAFIQLPRELTSIFRNVGETPPENLTDFIEGIVSCPKLQELDEFENAIARTSGLDAARIACALSFRLGEWERSRYFAERVIRMISTNRHEADEFEYLRLVSARFSGLTLADLQANRRSIEAQASRYGRANNDYGLARALSEAAAQCLFFVYSQALMTEKDSRAPEFYILQIAHDANMYLERARRLQEWSFDAKTLKVPLQKIRLLKIQTLANLLSVYFFLEFQPTTTDFVAHVQKSPPIDVIDELLRLTTSDERKFYLGEFYALCAAKQAGSSRWGKKHVDRMQILLRAFGQDIHEEIDQREVKWLCRKLGLQGVGA